ncbi:MAG: M23 family metallopeptidase [Acidimicrobiia bacterium]|nr:M23 family metallopeptidase [Acidimicrobiia bacterium]
MRKLILLAVLSALASSLVISVSPVGADEGFEFTYFPHEGLDIEFSNDWGNPRDGGARTHKGNDVFSPKMTPVIAVADGFVTMIGKGDRPGYQVRIRHANGWQTWYFHLNNDSPGTDNNRGGPENAFAEGLEEGMFVEAGTVIGFVGDSGNAEHTEPHTHFELRRGGQAINPYYHLRDAWRWQQRVYRLFDSLELD